MWLNSTKLAEPGFAHIKPRDATSKPQQPASLVTFTLTTPPLKQGVNTLEITFSKNTATSKPITLQRVHLALDYE